MALPFHRHNYDIFSYNNYDIAYYSTKKGYFSPKIQIFSKNSAYLSLNCDKRIQKAIDKFISILANRLFISCLCLKIERISCQYSSSLKKKSSFEG